ncbi:MAG: hypothetical protein ACF8AM_13975 [Rhodopirellula sp. JB055]|uniref:hypothetical protein n=1 Tax=Rhodopirellula sp. JB055 TaxID=3342846 RepID=UPI00370B2784
MEMIDSALMPPAAIAAQFGGSKSINSPEYWLTVDVAIAPNKFMLISREHEGVLKKLDGVREPLVAPLEKF